MAAEPFTFTKSALEALPIPQNDREFHRDAVERALVCAVHQTGTKTFLVYKKHQGRPVKIKLGEFDPAIPDSREIARDAEPLDLIGNNASLNVRMARKLATAVRAELDAGRNPLEAKQARRGALTFGEAFEIYFDRHLLAAGKKSVNAIRQAYETYLGKLPEGERRKHGRERTKPKGAVDWHNRALSEIDTGDVARLHAALGKRGTRRTANAVVEIVSAVYNKAIAWKLHAGPNPASGIKPYREVKRDRFLQEQELPKFFEAVATEPSKDVRDAVLLMLLSGARRMNVLQMSWAEVSLERAEWRIPDTKSGEPQVVPLVPEAIAVLQSRAEDRRGFVFPAKSASGHMTPIKKAWARIRERAGLPDLRVHDLRRSAGSWMAKSGASLVVVGKALGHSSPAATAIYARLDSQPVRDAMTRATSAMLSAGGLKRRAAVTKMIRPSRK